MRLLIAGLVMMTTVASAQAQMGPQASQMNGAAAIGRAAGQSAGDGSAGHKIRANDKAYNAALKNLPDKQYDPWRGVR